MGVDLRCLFLFPITRLSFDRLASEFYMMRLFAIRDTGGMQWEHGRAPTPILMWKAGNEHGTKDCCCCCCMHADGIALIVRRRMSAEIELAQKAVVQCRTAAILLLGWRFARTPRCPSASWCAAVIQDLTWRLLLVNGQICVPGTRTLPGSCPRSRYFERTDENQKTLIWTSFLPAVVDSVRGVRASFRCCEGSFMNDVKINDPEPKRLRHYWHVNIASITGNLANL